VSSEEIGDLLMILWQRWRSASPVRRGAITREQYWILRILSEGGPMRVKDLAFAIGCTAGSASVAVKRLEKAGLVNRKRNEKDERVVTVILGKKGVERLGAWRAEQLSSMAALFEPLSPEERRMMRDLLGKSLAMGGDLPTLSTKSSGGGKR
jgi:DNA-binding MarR family transcriptional regulator